MMPRVDVSFPSRFFFSKESLDFIDALPNTINYIAAYTLAHSLTIAY